MQKFKPNNREAGFSLLELLLVVGVGALLLLAGLATYRLITEGNNINAATTLLNTIKNQTQQLYANQGTYGGGGAGVAFTDTLVRARAFPAGVVDGGDTPRDPWGNPIVVSQTAADGLTFDITLTNITDANCIKLGMAFDPEIDADMLQIDIEGDVYDDATPPTINLVDGSCDGGANGNTLTWTFY